MKSTRLLKSSLRLLKGNRVKTSLKRLRTKATMKRKRSLSRLIHTKTLLLVMKKKKAIKMTFLMPKGLKMKFNKNRKNRLI